MLKSSFELRTIGDLLKERRKDQGFSFEQIVEETKIRREYLEALEEGRYNDFPSEVYLKGFLKNYAKHLGINTERAIAMYRRERDYKKHEPTISTTEKIRQKGLTLALTPTRAIAGLLIFAIFLGVIYFAGYIGQVLKLPNIKIVNPILIEAGNTGSIKTSENNVVIEGEFDIGSTLKINGQQYETNNFSTFSESFRLQAGQNTFNLVAESQFGRTNEISLLVFFENQTQDNNLIEATPEPPLQKLDFSGNITITNRDAYLEGEIDNNPITSRVYTVGEKIEFNNITQLSLTFSNNRPK